MIDEISGPSELSPTETVGTRAADWMLARQMNAKWSAKEQSEFEAWMSESTLHRVTYWRLEETWLRSKRLKALHSPMRPSSRPDLAQMRTYITGIVTATIVGVIFAAAKWPWNGLPPETKTYSTPVGGHLSLALRDGSKIELNTDTTVTISTSANVRSAVLQKGEALFSIRHNQALPFVVSASGHRIIDLGTQFLVRDDRSRVSVSLIEGSARFESVKQNGDVQVTDMMPGDVVRATRDKMSITRRSASELENSVAWRKGLLVFHNTPFADAVRDLNRYNDQKIIIADASIEKLTIGGTFFENDVHAVLNTAQQVFGLSIHKKGNDFVISR